MAFAKTYGTLQPPLRYAALYPTFSVGAKREPLSRWYDLSQHAWELLNLAAALRDGVKRSEEEWWSLQPMERALSSIRRPLIGGPEPRSEHEQATWIQEAVDVHMRFFRFGPVPQLRKPWHGHAANPATFADEIDQHPAAIALLDVVEPHARHLGAAQAAADQRNSRLRSYRHCMFCPKKKSQS